MIHLNGVCIDQTTARVTCDAASKLPWEVWCRRADIPEDVCIRAFTRKMDAHALRFQIASQLDGAEAEI